MKVTSLVTCIAGCLVFSTGSAFSPNLGVSHVTHAKNVSRSSSGLGRAIHENNFLISSSSSKATTTTILQSQRNALDNTPRDENNNNPTLFSSINTPYLLAWLSLITFAFILTPGGLYSPESNDLMAKLIENPQNPQGVNELFLGIFTLFIPIPMIFAALLMPGYCVNKNVEKLNAIPFLMASTFVGYFALGPYMSIRKECTTPISRGSLGWFTRNVLENRLSYVGLTIFTLYCLVQTGVFSALINDFQGTLAGYQSLFSTTSLVSVSTLDLSCLTIVAASLIPEDLQRRGVNDENKARLIAASTLLFPVVGCGIYCALRPDLPSNDAEE